MSTDHQQNQPSNTTVTTTSEHRPSIVCNLDGTYTRTMQFPCTPATPDSKSDFTVLSKDVSLNPEHQTWLRVYLPRQAIDASPTEKLPLIVYYHGGGFVFLSAASTLIHDFCVKLGAHLPAVIVSVDYRLAPEHRLPAAYDDAVEALHWIKAAQEEWITEFADLSNCFLMGTSAGGNIAYHAGLRAAAALDELEPLKIKGLILHHAFFGGSERTGSELRLANDRVLPLWGLDYMWELSLPVGSDRDHEYGNPTAGGGSDQLELVRLADFRILVTGGHDDPLIDRQMELAKMLEGKGLCTVAHYNKGYHSIEFFDESKAKELFGAVENFIATSNADDH